jgi:hypothetical protein
MLSSKRAYYKEVLMISKIVPVYTFGAIKGEF